jgi:hypothetical protein
LALFHGTESASRPSPSGGLRPAQKDSCCISFGVLGVGGRFRVVCGDDVGPRWLIQARRFCGLSWGPLVTAACLAATTPCFPSSPHRTSRKSRPSPASGAHRGPKAVARVCCRRPRSISTPPPPPRSPLVMVELRLVLASRVFVPVCVVGSVLHPTRAAPARTVDANPKAAVGGDGPHLVAFWSKNSTNVRSETISAIGQVAHWGEPS